MAEIEIEEFQIGDLEQDTNAVPLDDDGRMHDEEAYNETADPKDLREAIPQRWRNAKANLKLREQVDAKYPDRKKTSDGTIGDTNHCPGTSDHCPNIVVSGTGIVTAIDITHDPDNGCDAHAISDTLLASKDSRIKYIISNGRIGSSYPKGSTPAWTWRTYSGSNPHTKHMHLSVQSASDKYDDTSEWQI